MRAEDIGFSLATPRYEVRLRRHGPGDTEVAVWQMPAVATPQVTEPIRIAGLRGRNFDLLEHRVLRRLAQAGKAMRLDPASPAMALPLDEDNALHLALLFRLLAPMRHRDRIRVVAEGVEAMGREEAAYWLGMAMHRRNPRRVLTALRFLLTDSNG